MSALHISSEGTKTPEQTFSDLLQASLLERDDSVQAALETGLTGGVKDASQDRRGAAERNSLDAEVTCRHSHLPGSPAQRQTEGSPVPSPQVCTCTHMCKLVRLYHP